jgi:hypothetical protein
MKVTDIEGMKVKFIDGDLAARYPDDYTIELVHPNTGGVCLKELDGFFDPSTLRVGGSERTVEQMLFMRENDDNTTEMETLTPTQKPSSDAGSIASTNFVLQIAGLAKELPEPSLHGGETGVADMWFYRCPVVGFCFCGCPRRMTLAGARCERGHEVNEFTP